MAEVMETCCQALEDRDRDDANILDEDIEIGDEELQHKREQAETVEDPTQYIFICSKVQAMIVAEMRKSVSQK